MLPSGRAALSTAMSSGILAGKVAVVTGSTEGIGYSVARRLAFDGASVMVSSRKESNVNRAVQTLQTQGLKVAGTVCHAGREEDRAQLLEKTQQMFGGIDILVCNAAVNPFVGNILESKEDVWDKILDLNVKCTFLIIKESVPYMKKQGGGSVVIVSSITGYQPFPIKTTGARLCLPIGLFTEKFLPITFINIILGSLGFFTVIVGGVTAERMLENLEGGPDSEYINTNKEIGPYSVSKSALLSLTKTLAPALADHNIRVNSLVPGVIRTKFSSYLWNNEKILGTLSKRVPLKRIGEPDECAGTVSFLCSPDASYITGESVVVAGGLFSSCWLSLLLTSALHLGNMGQKSCFHSLLALSLEGMGQIAALGLEESHNLTRGQPVAHLANGTFADYKVVSISSTFLLPSLHPTYMALPLSGTAALLGLNLLAKLRLGQVVLVMMAAVGPSHLAIQQALHAWLS